jgi:hypothetical protein
VCQISFCPESRPQQLLAAAHCKLFNSHESHALRTNSKRLCIEWAPHPNEGHFSSLCSSTMRQPVADMHTVSTATVYTGQRLRRHSSCIDKTSMPVRPFQYLSTACSVQSSPIRRGHFRNRRVNNHPRCKGAEWWQEDGSSNNTSSNVHTTNGRLQEQR